MIAAGVDVGHVLGEVETGVDVGTSFGVVVVVLGQARVDGFPFAAETVLELGELVEGERVGQACLDEAVLFGDDLGAPAGEGVCFGGDGCCELIEFTGEHFARCVAGGCGVPDALVIVGNEALDLDYVHGLSGADGAFLVSAKANEVGVDVAVACLCGGDHQPGSAATAVDGAF